MQKANVTSGVKIEVYNIRTPKPGENWGLVKAIVDILITPPGLIIRGFKIIGEAQKFWISPPYQKIITNNTGEKVYQDLLYFPEPSLWHEIKRVIRQAYQGQEA